MPLTNPTGSVMTGAFVAELSSSGMHLPQVLAQVAVISPIVLSIASPPAIIWDPNSFYLTWEVALLPVVFLVYTWFFLTGLVLCIYLNALFSLCCLYSFA